MSVRSLFDFDADVDVDEVKGVGGGADEE